MQDHDQGATSHPLDGDAAVDPTGPVFSDLGLSPALLTALRERGYRKPTPIQARAIPVLLRGRDLLGIAQTGTGKTAAFALPVLERLRRSRRRSTPGCPRVLVLTPTRELAAQIQSSFEAYGSKLPVRTAVVFGGVGQAPQVRALRRGVEVLVATPGRLLDLMGQRHVDLSRVETFVLDEADRMLDMGFLRDVRRVVDALPARRQSLLFSATMPKDIAALASTLLHEPERVEVAPPSSTVERVVQHVCFVEKAGKRDLLSSVLADDSIRRVLVFTRTKHGANRVARHLEGIGVTAAAIHGNKSQGARERALEAFRAGALRVLVATDIAARGLDVPGITHVLNFDLPNVPESYVHRIGRTARAGREGVAISFCDASERPYLKQIQREIGMDLGVLDVEMRSGPRAPRERGTGHRPQRPRGNSRRPRRRQRSAAGG